MIYREPDAAVPAAIIRHIRIERPHTMRLSAFVSIALALFMFATPARAITNENVLSWSDEQQYTYMAASVEMAAFMASVAGDRDRSRCIIDWFFRDDSGTATIYNAMHEFLDHTPQTLIYLLINRQCGEPAVAGQ